MDRADFNIPGVEILWNEFSSFPSGKSTRPIICTNRMSRLSKIDHTWTIKLTRAEDMVTLNASNSNKQLDGGGGHHAEPGLDEPLEKAVEDRQYLFAKKRYSARQNTTNRAIRVNSCTPLRGLHNMKAHT